MWSNRSQPSGNYRSFLKKIISLYTKLKTSSVALPLLPSGFRYSADSYQVLLSLAPPIGLAGEGVAIRQVIVIQTASFSLAAEIVMQTECCSGVGWFPDPSVDIQSFLAMRFSGAIFCLSALLSILSVLEAFCP